MQPPAQFVEIKKPGTAKNLLKNPIVGVILVIAALGLLIWNEGRADMSQIAATAQELNPDAVAAEADVQGKPISVTGMLTTPELLGDSQYLKPGQYLMMQREVEMYAWMEVKNTKTTADNQEEVTYDYQKQWLRTPLDHYTFKVPSGHENPVMAVRDYTAKATVGKIGAYSLDMAGLTVAGLEPLNLTFDNIISFPGVSIDRDNILFVGRGTPYVPEIGDLRIKYTVLPANIVATVFGALRGSVISTYTDAENNTLYRMMKGNRAQALSAMQKEEVIMTWVARVIGLLLVWGGAVVLLPRIAASMNPMTIRIVGLIIALVLTAVGVFVGSSMA